MNRSIFSNITKRSHNVGFTLLELMLTVTIIGVLAAIALPAYTQYVERAKRTEGKTALMEVAGRLERFYSDNNRFATSSTSFPVEANIETESENGYYNITINSPSPFQTYTLTAAPTFTDSLCGSLSLDNAGTRTVSTATASDICWK